MRKSLHKDAKWPVGLLSSAFSWRNIVGLRTWLGLKKPPYPPRPDFVRDFKSKSSRAQLFQDLWVLSETGSKRGGFFVEVGAFDGMNLSNTYLLEKAFGWTGILAEPNHLLTDQIRAARTAPLCTDPVDGVSGREVTMLFVSDLPELSGMKDHAFNDRYGETRQAGIPVQQITVSLNDLLSRYDAPSQIDFISIDTEGSEPDILSTFGFDRFDVRLFCIEHNYTDAEKRLDQIMLPRGYERVHREWSQWDAWYRKQGTR